MTTARQEIAMTTPRTTAAPSAPTGLEVPVGLDRAPEVNGAHQCVYPEIRVGRDAADASSGHLLPGDRALVPCRDCGATPLDALDWAESTLDTTEAAFSALALSRGLSLYHWSPVAKRRQIIRHGLLPHRRATTHATPGWRAPYVCFGDTAAWAWALSGGQPSAPSGEWDLWETRIVDLVDPKILPAPDVANGIHEIRTEHRVYKRHLWLVGQRVKP